MKLNVIALNESSCFVAVAGAQPWVAASIQNSSSPISGLFLSARCSSDCRIAGLPHTEAASLLWRVLKRCRWNTSLLLCHSRHCYSQ